MGARAQPSLGYPPGADKPEDANNHRNGTSGKTALTDAGSLRIEVSRDRESSFEPVLIPKHESRSTGLHDRSARGITMREVQGFVLESYGVESLEFMSTVTGAVMAEVGGGPAQPLEPMKVAFFDALRVKIREERSCATIAI